MENPARKETNKLLDDLEKRIAEEYGKAAEEMKEKANKYFERFKERDEKQKELVKNGQLSQSDYLKWRTSAMTYNKRYTDMVDHLTTIAVKSDQEAVKWSKDILPDVFATNANYGQFEAEVLTGVEKSWTLYNREAVVQLARNDPDLLPAINPESPKGKWLAENKDKIWNKRHINSAILQGILQGEGVVDIAKRLTDVTDMDSRAAIRNARTMVTSAENRGKKYAYEMADEMGLHVKNMWMATHDGRTRISHSLLDGQVRELDEEFSNGLMYPGDPDGDDNEIYNCRCSLVAYTDYSIETIWAFRARTGMQADPDKAWSDWKAAQEAKKG